MLIEVENIHKTYKEADYMLHVLKGVHLSIDVAQVIAIIGPSGAGKSTLMHMMGALDAPSQGKVYFEGQDIYALGDKQRSLLRNSQMGFVFQAYHLLPELTALENVILPAMVKNNSRKTSAIEHEGVKLLEQVGLGQRVSHRPSQLSGGEQQRVAIARALMNKPKVVFCDEPTGNLDSQSGHMVIDLLLNLNKTSGQTVVIVTHDQTIAQRAQKVIHIKDGIVQ